MSLGAGRGLIQITACPAVCFHEHQGFTMLLVDLFRGHTDISALSLIISRLLQQIQPLNTAILCAARIAGFYLEKSLKACCRHNLH